VDISPISTTKLFGKASSGFWWVTTFFLIGQNSYLGGAKNRFKLLVILGWWIIRVFFILVFKG